MLGTESSDFINESAKTLLLGNLVYKTTSSENPIGKEPLAITVDKNDDTKTTDISGIWSRNIEILLRVHLDNSPGT